MRITILFFMMGLVLWARPSYNVAIVDDGKSENGEGFGRALKSEIVKLLGYDFDVHFPKAVQTDAHWDIKRIEKGISRAMNSPQADIVVTLGALSSHVGGRWRRLQKPLVATAVIDPKMQGISYHDGVSGKHNLAYVSAHATLRKDIEAINEALEPSTAAILIDAELLGYAPQIGKYLKKVFARNDIEAALIPVSGDGLADLDKIAPETEIVYVTPLFRQSREQRKAIYDHLRSRELPSFAAAGVQEVRLGAMFSNAPALDRERYIRQIALDIQQIALGAPAEEQPVDFTPQPSLSINLRTAKEVGFDPSWEFLSKAVIIEDEYSDSHYFTLEEIMDRATHFNLNVVAAGHDTESARQKYERSRSRYLPQLYLGAEAAQIDEDRATASLGLYNQTRVDAYLKATQELYNQRLLAGISVNEHFMQAKQHARDYVKLEVAMRAATLYIRILQIKTQLEIEKSNLELSRTNMRAAEVKKNIGIGRNSDIYRWKSQIAQEKRRMLETYAKLQQVRYTLNALLNLPQELPLNFKETQMQDGPYLTRNRILLPYFEEPKRFSALEGYLVEVGRSNVPTLKQISQIAQARRRIVESNKEAFYAPDLSLEGGVRQHFVTSQNNVRDTDPNLAKYPYADDTDWQIGMFLRFPLYLGGGKTSDLERSRAELLSTEAKKSDLENSVERDIRNTLYKAKAAYLSIGLAEEAYKSARANLKVVKDIYSQGGVDIIVLLDAQNTALKAALSENNARYGFLESLLMLQYRIGQVNFNLDEEKWAAFLAGLQRYEEEME